MTISKPPTTHTMLALPEGGQAVSLAVQKTSDRVAKGTVLYVHGATFGTDASVFLRLNGASWADALNAAGYDVWGLDFLGYGRSPRQVVIDKSAPGAVASPEGRAASALPQLRLAINHIRSVIGAHPVYLVAHSWGSIPALLYAAQHADQVGKLVLFGAIASRKLNLTVPNMGATRNLSVWEQYRRFIEDVPKGQAQVLSDQNMQEWVTAHLQSPVGSAPGSVPSVVTPNGPMVDIMETWSDKPVYDAAQVQSPILLVRGEWDSVSSEADTAVLMQVLGSAKKRHLTIPKATHLMHLESGRTVLYQAVNDFLGEP